MSDVMQGEAAASAGSQDSTNLTSGADAPGVGEFSDAMMERPSYVPEKFFKDGRINIKAMAESYGELERARSSQQPTPTPAPAASPKADDSKPSQPDAPAADTSAQPPVVIPGVTPEAMTKFSSEMSKDGKLSDSSYAELAKLGYPKAVVDAYTKGLTADARIEQAIQDVRIADKEIAAIKESIGGEKVLNDMLQWASNNLDAKDIAVYNDAVSGNDSARVKMAVQGMFHAYKQSQGPNLIGGRPPSNGSTGEPFKSSAEVVKAMEDPRYDRDPAYRDEVAKRLAVSNVFGQSREYKTRDSY